MPSTKVDDQLNVSGSSTGSSQNAGDAMIEIVRDALHGHLNTAARVGDLLIPKSIGTILRHEVPQYGASARDLRGLWPFGCDLWNALTQNVRYAMRTSSSGVSNVTENADSFSIEFTVPGWDRAELEVLVSPRDVRVRGRKAETKGETMLAALGIWTSSEPLARDRVTATLDKGILQVMVYKGEESRAQKVEINQA